MQSSETIDIQAYVKTTLGNVAQFKALSIEQIKSIIQNHNAIFAVVSTPKSGSTFLTTVLSKSLNLPHIPLCYAYSSNEHDLYLPALVIAAMKGAVSQLHTKGTPHNAQLLNFFDIKPIVLTRNIFDSVESLARDLKKKCMLNQLGQGVHGYSFTWLTKDIANLNDDQLIDFVIDFALPWYVNFYVSWHSLANNNMIDPLFVRYEDIMKNKQEEVSKIIRTVANTEVNLDTSILEKNYISESSGISRGTGNSGLGIERLSTAQIHSIKKLLSYYPDINFDTWVEYE